MASARRDLWWAAGILIALLAAVLLILPPGAPVPLDQRLSTYRTSPDGAGALYQALVELNVPVARRLTPMVGADPIRGPLAILSPSEPLSPAEVAAVIAWVEAGGHLIVAGAGFDPLMDGLGLATWGGRRQLDLVPGARHRWVQGMDRVGPAQRVFADTLGTEWDDAEPLLVADYPDDAWAALLVARGAGAVLALSDPGLLANGRIADDGVAPLVVRAALDWTADGVPLWFDEYHHGYRGGSMSAGVWAFLTGHPAGRMALQLALVGLLGVAATAIRFGRPVDLVPPARRSPVEHVAALGEAYRHARAHAVARRRLVAGFARRIGRERPRPGTEADFLERIERRVPTGGEAVAAVRAGWRDEVPVLELARRIDRAVNRLSGDR